MSLLSIDLNQLVILHALLEERSVSRAAARIGRSQSGTSHALARLRAHFGDPLLIRDGWEMRLSRRAEALRLPVHEAVQRMQVIFADDRGFDPAVSARVFRIGAPDICIPLLTDLIGRVAAEAPRVQLELVELLQPSDAVRRGEVDLAFGFGDQADDGLRREVLMTLDWAVFCRDGHGFVARSALAAWSQAMHIQVRSGGAGPVENAARRAGVDRHVAVFAPNFLAAVTIAANSDLLFTTLRQPFEALAARLGLCVLPPPIELPGAAMMMIMPPDYGDQGLAWLQARVLSAYRQTNGDV